LAALAAVAVTGCKKPYVKTYVAPRELPGESAVPAAAPAAAEEMPELKWTLPEGWKETGPGQMSLASFTIEDGNGKATVNITPLPNLEGREEAVVNMWREQVELGPLSSEEVAKALQPVEVAGGQGKIFEINGTREGKPARTVTAVLHRGNNSWFFKLSGDDATASAQKDKFMAFIKSVRFVQPTATASAPASRPASASASEGASQFKTPESWRVLPAGQMQVAKFAVPEKDGAKAEVSVSVFPSDTGGTLANVNRWRGQLGLGQIDEAGLKSCTSSIDGTPGAVLVNLSNDTRQLVGAIVPRDGKWWFYKLLGDAPAVAAAQADFVKFVSTAP
jgi:hypothetical protein